MAAVALHRPFQKQQNFPAPFGAAFKSFDEIFLEQWPRDLYNAAKSDSVEVGVAVFQPENVCCSGQYFPSDFSVLEEGDSTSVVKLIW